MIVRRSPFVLCLSLVVFALALGCEEDAEVRAEREQALRAEPPVDTGSLNDAMGARERIMPKLPTPQDRLLFAVREGDQAQVEQWLKRGAKLSAGEGVLVAAVRGKGDEGFVRWLAKRGAPVDEADPSGRTPLSWAAGHGEASLVRFLLAREVQRDAVDQLGRAPIHYAVFSGDVDTIAAILEAGAPINAQDNLGSTPLMYACSKDLAEVVALLDEAGANWEVLDKLGRTAADRAHAPETPCPP